MYDIGTQAVSRLKGELSTSFVNVAESNADAQMNENGDDAAANIKLIDSKIFEQMPSINAADPEKVTIIEAQSSKSHRVQPVFVHSHLDSVSAGKAASNFASTQKVSISSGYSVIKR